MLSPTGLALLQIMAGSPRGPRRDGIFALWLTARLLEDPMGSDRGRRKRADLLARRISSLTLSPPLRRALTKVLTDLSEGDPEPKALLCYLAATARDGLGAEVADVLTAATKTTH